MPHSNVTNIPCPVEASHLRRRKALADALAGVVATLVSLWTFYPIDVLKTKLQAGVVSDKGSSSALFRGLFRGLPLKTLHAASSSFAYFYLYSFIASWWTHHYSTGKKMSPAVRLSLSAIAAMINTLLTLPLDVLASKKQAQTKDDNNSNNGSDTLEESVTSGEENNGLSLAQQQKIMMEEVWKGLEPPLRIQEDESEFYDSCSEEEVSGSAASSFDSSYSSAEEEKVGDRDEYGQQGQLKFTVTTRTAHLAADNNGKEATKSFLAQLPSLWKGLYPSLLLCSNPSIHYTVFDIAKSHLLQSKPKNDNLSMSEAFLLGLFAKFCATIATYPLIRTKVMLMVTSRRSMLKTLVENYQQDGIVRGCYKGCSVQLLHTVLKSALLMMVKERISATTHQLLVPPPSSRAQAPRRS